MRGSPVRAALLLAALLCGSFLAHGTAAAAAAAGGDAVEVPEDDAAEGSSKGYGSASWGEGGDAVGRGEQVKYFGGGGGKAIRSLGSRMGFTPPSPIPNRMKSMIYHAPPPPCAVSYGESCGRDGPPPVSQPGF